jgi:molybdopterin-containing oxidoreductase family iron-sulfur binding subunit
MMGIMGASFAMAGLAGCRRPVEHIVPYVDAPETVIPGVPRHFATTVPFGTSAYGVVVESHENRPTKLEGNALHPSSLGAANSWMHASLLDLYDPERANAVLQRETVTETVTETGGEGEGETASLPPASAATWEDFEAFWQGRSAELLSRGGEGLVVLSAAYASPTYEKLRSEFLGKFPQARFVVWEPVGDENIFAGCEEATGQRCRPVYDLEKAKVIVSLDADFLGVESDSLSCSRGFSRGRKMETHRDEMNRLYVVESALSITGSMADHRVRLKSQLVGAFAAALGAELGIGVEASDLPAGVQDKVALIAADLREAGAGALVIAGQRQPASVHALALAITQALGALGETVTLHELRDTGSSDPEALGALVEAMRQGSVSDLVICGGNPVYDAPADLEFAGALAQVAHSVHLSDRVDETSLAVEWHLPAAHYLETWGDARAANGTLSVVQPLIAPLLGGRSPIELVALLVRDQAVGGHELVRETWNQGLMTDSSENAWRKVLHDGLLADSSLPPLAVQPVVASAVERMSSDGLEITFHPSGDLFDGRFANNSWLQELPDSLTKLTWDNAAAVSPRTAEEFNLKSGDLVSLGVRDQSVEAVVFVLPGQADDSVAVSLGYGRTAVGRVGNDVGFDAYQLRHQNALHFDHGLSVTKVKGSYPISQTQEHWSMEGRELVREATLEKYRESPEEAFGERHFDPSKSHQPFADPAAYDKGPQWGIAIDLNSCTGCNACIVACQSENNIPVVGKEQVAKGREMHWLRVDRYFEIENGIEDPRVVFQPVPCMHCENAPCEQVCPVAATVHDSQGLNAMVYNRCIGTRYCSNNCPYKVRRFNFFNYTKDTPELTKMAMNPDVTVRSRGVMEKCSYCLQRISEAKIAAKLEERPLKEGDVKTACQQTCPTGAIVFGDILDPSSAVSRQKALDRDYVLLGELNNRPRTSYLARLRNPNTAWKRSAIEGGPAEA